MHEPLPLITEILSLLEGYKKKNRLDHQFSKFRHALSNGENVDKELCEKITIVYILLSLHIAAKKTELLVLCKQTKRIIENLTYLFSTPNQYTGENLLEEGYLGILTPITDINTNDFFILDNIKRIKSKVDYVANRVEAALQAYEDDVKTLLKRITTHDEEYQLSIDWDGDIVETYKNEEFDKANSLFFELKAAKVEIDKFISLLTDIHTMKSDLTYFRTLWVNILSEADLLDQYGQIDTSIKFILNYMTAYPDRAADQNNFKTECSTILRIVDMISFGNTKEGISREKSMSLPSMNHLSRFICRNFRINLDIDGMQIFFRDPMIQYIKHCTELYAIKNSATRLNRETLKKIQHSIFN